MLLVTTKGIGLSPTSLPAGCAQWRRVEQTPVWCYNYPRWRITEHSDSFAIKEKRKGTKEVNGYTNHAKTAIFITTLFRKTFYV